MAVYYATGITTAAVATGDSFAQLWNPAANRRIKVVEVAWGMRGDFDAQQGRITLERSTGRGATPNNTVTPDADNSGEGDAAPNSAAVLEMGPFGTDPTYAAPALEALFVDQPSGTAHQPYALLPIPRGIWLPPGSGLCWVFTIPGGGTYPNTEVSVVFED